MKRIPLRKTEGHDSKRFLFDVLKTTPHRTMNLDEMALRVKLIEALPKAEGFIDVENAEHAMMARAVAEFPYQVASRETLDMADDVQSAKAPAD